MADADATAARARLDAAHEEADRLIREARARAEESAGPGPDPAPDPAPPHGWAAPGGGGGAVPVLPDLQQLAALVELLRHSVPPELARQLADAVRELLLALRAIIDWNLDRLERPASAPVEVQDIPLD